MSVQLASLDMSGPSAVKYRDWVSGYQEER